MKKNTAGCTNKEAFIMNKETLTKYCKEYIENEKKMQELEARQKVIKARILENLADDNKPTTYDIAIKKVKPTTIFDSALFRKEYASLYNKYRTKEKAGYVAIKITRI